MPPDRRTRRVLVVLMSAGMFLVLLDVTAVNVAVPAIRAGLGVSISGVQWVVDAYTVTLAALLLLGGRLGDRFGHGRLVLAGLVVFGAASIACACAAMLGIATAPPVLVAARGVQGLGAALVLPASVAVITHAFPEPAEQARSLGVWAGVSSLALPAGPILGGVLVDTVGWPGIFWLNVPIVAVLAVAIRRILPRSPRLARAGATDVAGPLLLGAVVAAMVFTVISSGDGAGAAILFPGIVVAIGGCVALVAVERRAADPALPPRVVGRVEVLRANALSFLMNVTGNGTLFVATLYLQSMLGLTALTAGLALVPAFVPLVVLSPLAGRLAARAGHALPLRLGAGFSILGQLGVAGTGITALLGVSTETQPVLLAFALLVVGAGLGFFNAPVVSLAIAAVPADRAGVAGGLNNTARQLGTAIGVAVFGAIVAGAEDPADFAVRLAVCALLSVAAWLAALALIRPVRPGGHGP